MSNNSNELKYLLKPNYLSGIEFGTHLRDPTQLNELRTTGELNKSIPKKFKKVTNRELNRFKKSKKRNYKLIDALWFTPVIKYDFNVKNNKSGKSKKQTYISTFWREFALGSDLNSIQLGFSFESPSSSEKRDYTIAAIGKVKPTAKILDMSKVKGILSPREIKKYDAAWINIWEYHKRLKRNIENEIFSIPRIDKKYMLNEVKANYDTHTLIVFDVEAVFDHTLEKIDMSGKELTGKFIDSHRSGYWEWFDNMIMNKKNRNEENSGDYELTKKNIAFFKSKGERFDEEWLRGMIEDEGYTLQRLYNIFWDSNNESEEEAAAAPPNNKSGGRSKKKKSKKRRSKYNDMTVKQLRVLVKKRGKKITKRDGSGYNTKAQLIAKLKRK